MILIKDFAKTLGNPHVLGYGFYGVTVVEARIVDGETKFTTKDIEREELGPMYGEWVLVRIVPASGFVGKYPNDLRILVMKKDEYMKR